MTPRTVFTFLLIGAASWLTLAALAQDITCSQATATILKSPVSVDYKRITELEKVAAILLDESQNLSTSCTDYIIERGLFEYGETTERFSNTLNNDSNSEKFWVGKAAEAYINYINWWLDLDDTRQSALIKLYLRIPQDDASPPDWNERKAKWIRRRIGNAVNSLASCLIRAGKTNEVLTRYEAISTKSTDVFPAESVSEWYKWLLALPDFDRTKIGKSLKNSSRMI